MPRFISTALIKKIADHHDANPTDYREFRDGSLVLVTSEGGLVSDAPREELRREHRVTDVVDTLEVVGVTAACLVIGDGTRYVIVRRK